MKATEREVMDALASTGGHEALRLRSRLQVEQEEMTRLEKDETDMKRRFVQLRQRIVARESRGHGSSEDVNTATRRVDVRDPSQPGGESEPLLHFALAGWLSGGRALLTHALFLPACRWRRGLPRSG